MAGRKPAKTLDERILEIDAKIQKAEDELKELKKLKKDLENEKRSKEKEEILSFIEEYDLTIDDLKELVREEE